jgi:hypothetical protein
LVRAIAIVPRWLVRPLRLSRPIGGARRLLLQVGGHAAALDHEVVDDAVEHRAVVVAGLDVLEEVVDRLRRLGGVELDDDVALRGGELHLLGERRHREASEKAASAASRVR